ncbi:hypothetical protein [Actinacidiphila bryophytorum]|uniref:DUF7847 domain-containing protein n=1 Tax=Actinacidiphila bryophytorum TaxID=1436133 RepID=A0A9W4GYM0_9ACTN|nr:hypothetical protein [Actinacidiphila bryophytorum]MBM9440403.1 hypothetical protein [Actinacidiphila bryophytorum]MBN6546577.1 hypothetical protein [Actinacidiphila bryophytorum]CAG7622598.1 conserved membrane hypothetical protein [Actinacidiphila bryophytorum]
MTNTPGWASPGSSGSQEPDGGDSPEDTPPAAPAAADDPADGTTGGAPGDTADNTADNTQDAPVSGVWSQQQPPAAPWQHTPSGLDPRAAAKPSEPAASPAAPPQEQAPPAAPTPQGTGRPAGVGQQWAPPTPPAAPQNGGPRWGPAVAHHGGPQPPYATKPPAPQPGVIPLRPLDVGEILQGAVSTLRRHWRAAMLLAFVVGLLTESVNAVISGFLIDDTRIDDLNRNSDPSVHDILHAFSGAVAGSLLLILTSMVGVILTAGLLTVVISRAVLGRPTTVRSVWQDVRPRLGQLVGLALLVPLALCAILAVPAVPGLLIALAGGQSAGASIASLGLICGVVFSIWQWNLWSLTAPALMLEKQGVKAALKRSVKLVNGSWWRVLGVQLLMLLIAAVASVVIQLPFAMIADAVSGDDASGLFSASADSSWTTIIIVAVGGVISSTLTLPISAGAVSLLYVDQRIRREALDIDLGRAAKVPGYDAPTTVGADR